MRILIIYITFIFFSNYAFSQEFKVDLSNQIKKSVENKVIDASEKKKAGLLFYRLASEIDNLDVNDLLEMKINSVEYLSGRLTVNYSMLMKESASQLIDKNINELRKINYESLVNKSATKDQIYEINSKSTEGFIRFLLIKKSRDVEFYKPTIDVLDSSGVILTTLTELDENSFEYPRKQLLKKVGISLDTNLENIAVFELSPSIATRIKSLKFEKVESKSSVGIKVRSTSDELKKLSQNILSTLNSNNIIEDFQIKREIALRKFISDSQTAFSPTKTAGKIYTYHYLHIVQIFNLIDHIVFYSIIETNVDSSILKYEHDDIFKIEKNVAYVDGKKIYKFQYSNASKTGCDAFIPDNYQYNNPSSVFGVNPTKEVNALMSQLGMINDSTVSGLPDGKIRVISGKISALTNDGGIIYNNSQYGDAKPIEYTLTNKSKIIKQSDIKLESVLVRIVGTYNQNTKIQLRNNVGGSRNVDAINLDVLCIEPIASDQDLMNILFK